jgi:hypothetical protein
MGATGWSYFVSYQEDIDQVLQELREQVFNAREYQPPNEPSTEEFETAKSYLASLSLDPEKTRKELDALITLSQAFTRPRKTTRTPTTIEQLLEQCGEEGTHSILDIERVSPTPEFAAITALSHDQLLAIFDTIEPTHAMVEKWSKRIDPMGSESLYGRWEGIYIIVYEDGQPAEIYFEGTSGD